MNIETIKIMKLEIENFYYYKPLRELDGVLYSVYNYHYKIELKKNLSIKIQDKLNIKFIKDSFNFLTITKNHIFTPEIYFNKLGIYCISHTTTNTQQITKISNYTSENIQAYTIGIKELKYVLEVLQKNKKNYDVGIVENQLVIIQDKWTIRLNLFKTNNTYESSFSEKQTVFTMDYKQAKTFNKSHCMGSDYSQVAYTGMYLDFNDNKIVTTNGKSLDVLNTEFLLKLENCILDKEFILKAISKMKKDDIIEIKYSNNEYFINDNNIKVIEGKFPNFNDVIPSVKVNVIKIKDHKEFYKKIENIKNSSDKESHRIVLEIKDNLLYFNAGTVHSRACEVLEIENISKTNISLSCDYKSLQKLVNENNIEVVLNSSTSPILLIKENSQSITMPMKNYDSIAKTMIEESNIVEIKEVNKIEQKTKPTPKEIVMEKNNTGTTPPIKEDINTYEVLKDIKDTYKPTLLRMKELVNTILQYEYEGRLDTLTQDLEKTEFKGLSLETLQALLPCENIKELVLKLYTDKTPIELVDSMPDELVEIVTSQEPTTQAEVVELINPCDPIEIVERMPDELVNLIDNNTQNDPRFIIKLFTDRQKSKVLSPEVFKIDTIEGDFIISNGYKYSVHNIGKVKFSKKGKGSASINLTLDHKPTMNELKDLSDQFISKIK